jgi:hypothetical protein
MRWGDLIKGGAPSLTVVVMAALIGCLAGFVYSITAVYHGFSQGAGPLLANALGAAIGASITLWATDRRARNAAAKESHTERVLLVADLAQVKSNLMYIARDMERHEASGTTYTAIRTVDDLLSHQREMLRVLAKQGFLEDYATLSYLLGHAARLMNDLNNLPPAEKVEAVTSDSGPIFAKEFRLTIDAVDQTLTNVKRAMQVA